MKKILVLLLVFAFGATAMAQEKTVRLKVGATPVPHAQILNLVKDDLRKEGIILEVVEFTDYITPNMALDSKQIDANFFQHKPYLDSFVNDRGLKLVSLAGIHIEPLGLYSNKHKNISELPQGAIIAIPNDPTNGGRALLLLQANGLIKLEENAGLRATPRSVAENPKKFRFRELDAAQLPRSLRDVDAAVINGNYAMEAKLNPVKDALILEDSQSPYVNIIAVREGTQNDPRLVALVNALKSDKVRKFILDSYNGGVVPVF